jgi:7-carboxy-7-deazaguanine synthase
MMPGKKPSTKLKIYSMFESASGEIGIVPQGTPTLFVRFAGCNLRCAYCDTKRAQDPNFGKELTMDVVLEHILNRTGKNGIRHVLLTGGEPLLQREASIELCRRLLMYKDRIDFVSIETNGTIFPPTLSTIEDRLSLVMDYKLGNAIANWKDVNLPPQSFTIPRTCFVKFVCSNRTDFDNACQAMEEIRSLDLSHRSVKFSFSAAVPHLAPADLWTWMRSSFLDAILNVQVHKIVWPDGEKGDSD